MDDNEIAIQLAAELIREQPCAPFKFAIYYDAKKEPPRVTVHRIIRNDTMGAVEFNVPRAARRWCEDALREGYTVVRFFSGKHESVAEVAAYRRRLERVTMTPEQRKALDDEIPF